MEKLGELDEMVSLPRSVGVEIVLAMIRRHPRIAGREGWFYYLCVETEYGYSCKFGSSLLEDAEDQGETAKERFMEHMEQLHFADSVHVCLVDHGMVDAWEAADQMHEAYCDAMDSTDGAFGHMWLGRRPPSPLKAFCSDPLDGLPSLTERDTKLFYWVFREESQAG